MKNREVAALTEKYVARTYARSPIALVKGKGARVWDADGKEYVKTVALVILVTRGRRWVRHCRLVMGGDILYTDGQSSTISFHPLRKDAGT